MKKIMLVFGTRPEAIKMCPLALELKKRKSLKTVLAVTAQHREMLDGVLSAFSLAPDYDLSVMKAGQTLFDITTEILGGIKTVLEKERPDLVLVHGDTSTAFSAALAAFYLHIPVGHVEAGLRTYDMARPFPEEFNRRAIALVASLHFAPTESAKENLLSEGVSESAVFVTGNTAVDALRSTVRPDYTHPLLSWAEGSRLILITAHRRESHGEPLYEMLRAVRRVLEKHGECRAVYPIHPSPAVKKAAEEIFSGFDRIRLVAPLDVLDFHNLLSRSYLVLTDSGGIQEEAAALRIPTLVLRDTTERPEGVSSGALKLVGTKEASIYEGFHHLLTDETEYNEMAKAKNPYGDGKASLRIADILEKTK